MINLFWPYISERVFKGLEEVLRGRWIGQGPRVDALEKQFAELVHAPHAVAVNACTVCHRDRITGPCVSPAGTGVLEVRSRQGVRRPPEPRPSDRTWGALDALGAFRSPIPRTKPHTRADRLMKKW